MTYKTYAQVIRSADENPFELFKAQWLLMPDCESIAGWDPANLDHDVDILRQVYDIVHRPMAEIRSSAGLTQQGLADRFAIPIRTVQNWESRNSCPVYVRLLIQQELGIVDLTTMLGVASPF